MTTPADPRASDAPNIVLILADDMGFSDIGCFGAEISTPNLDRLAAQGARLTQMYNSARCCPTRASLLTGLHPHQTGVGHMISDFGHPSYRGFLNDRCVTIAEALRPHGYRTFMSGKWHVGGGPWGTDPSAWIDGGEPGTRPRPIDRGFDHHFGTLEGAGSYFDPHTLISDEQLVTTVDPDFFYTDAIGDQAAGAIERYARGSQPFFVYVGYTAPHWPLHALPQDIERYRGRYRDGWDAVRTARLERLRDSGILDPAWPITPRDLQAPDWKDVEHREWEDLRMAVYAAQIDSMDQSIGRILDALQRTGTADNTLVMFLSDNGGCAEFLHEDFLTKIDLVIPHTRDGRPVRLGNDPSIEPGDADTYMSYDLPWANASNTPFRLYKHWVHEGGIATPFVACWPNEIPPGQILHEPCHVSDIMATCLEATTTPYPTEYENRPITPLEGESFLAMLRGEPWSRRDPICWEHEGNRAVRWGRWKLVSRHRVPWELYDMAEDRTELDDLAARNPQKVEELAGVWTDWASRCDVLPWERFAELIRASVGRD